MKLRIGSRGSQLALWQANHIAELLRVQGHEVEIEIIKTTGDRLQEVTFAEVGSKGMFTKEIEEALADGPRRSGRALAQGSAHRAARAVSRLQPRPSRADPRDVFVSVKYASLAELPRHARVGTSSQRRRAQLKALRPDVEAVEFRGNVDTRLRKLAEGQVDAILLAAAGLDRLGKTDWVRERLDPKDFCPAAGQGALGIETRKGDEATIAAVAFLDDADTRFAVTAERAALAALGGGCQVPIGIHCRPSFARERFQRRMGRDLRRRRFARNRQDRFAFTFMRRARIPIPSALGTRCCRSAARGGSGPAACAGRMPAGGAA